MEQENTFDPGFIQMVASGENLAPMLEEDKANEIGRKVCDDYDTDKQSMDDWQTRMQAAIDLAKLVKSSKDYPFPNSSNIKYPLVTTAALQFNARAYPALCPATDVVKAKVWGNDKDGRKAARGLRTSTYMSWQLSVEIEEWESETDKLTMQIAIVGDMFRKWWYDAKEGRVRCRLIEPGAYIVSATAQTLALAPRGSEELRYYPYQITEKERSGWFAPLEYDRTGDDDQEPEDFVEQQCRIDLDDDGYEEPYIATVHRETQKLVRLVADFTEADVVFDKEVRPVPVQVMRAVTDDMGNPLMGPMGPMAEPGIEMQPQEVPVGIISIQRNSYVCHHQFMPGFDSGLFGTGLGLLLGDISKAVNSTINMLMDAGHYASLGGGFIGADFRLKGGAQRMKPGEWRTVTATGGTVRESLVPLQYPGPDQTLFAMLGMLVEAAKEVSSTKDIMTGDTGSKSLTATTTLAIIEQGMQLFTAVYKRLFRSMSKEYRLLASLNAQYVSPEQYNAFLDDVAQDGQPVMHDPSQDFGAADMDITPVADPEAVTKMQEMAKAQLVMEMAQNGLANPQEAAKRIFEAASIDQVEELLPQPTPAQQMMEQLGMQAAQADVSLKMADIELKMAQVSKARADAFATTAEAERENAAQPFDQVMRMLEMQRDDLARSLDGSGRGMGGASGNGGASRQPRVAPVPVAQVPVGAIPFGTNQRPGLAF